MEMSTWSLGMLQELGLEGVITSCISFINKKKPQTTSNPPKKLKKYPEQTKGERMFETHRESKAGLGQHRIPSHGF